MLAADEAEELIEELVDVTLDALALVRDELARLLTATEVLKDELTKLLLVDDWLIGGFVPPLLPPPQAERKLIREMLIIRELGRIGTSLYLSNGATMVRGLAAYVTGFT